MVRRAYHNAHTRFGLQDSHATTWYAGVKSPKAMMSSGSSIRSVTAAKISA